MFRTQVAALFVSALTMSSVACGPGTAPAGQPPMARLATDTLESVRRAFNQASDHTRVILLLSPTCGTCLHGASAIDEVLKKYPNNQVTVFAVWQPMLPTDVSAPTTGTLGRISDRRVRQFYDEHHALAKQMKTDARPPQPTQDCCTRNSILWDILAVYAPGDQWTDKIPAATFFNGPIVDVTAGLEKALAGK